MKSEAESVVKDMACGWATAALVTARARRWVAEERWPVWAWHRRPMMRAWFAWKAWSCRRRAVFWIRIAAAFDREWARAARDRLDADLKAPLERTAGGKAVLLKHPSATIVRNLKGDGS